jgi:integrase
VGCGIRPNFAKQWCLVRADLGETLKKVTGHSFRKTLASIVTADTADPTVAADLLGHSDSSTTLRHYVSRNRLHPKSAELLNRNVTGIVFPDPRLTCSHFPGHRG